jgi:hypothetical protein
MSELVTNTDKEPHVHIKASAPKVKYFVEQTYRDKTASEVLFGYLNKIFWKEYTIRYRHDKDGDSEMYILRGHPVPDNNIIYLLTVHFFTCYCEPLNENTDPPF